MNINNLITEEYRQQGLNLKEDSDHIIELREDKQVLARFSQTGINIENLLKVCRETIRERRN